MLDIVEFVHDWFAEVETAPARMRQVAFRKGTTMTVEIRPVKYENGQVESANLRLGDGTTALRVPLWCISVGARAA